MACVSIRQSCRCERQLNDLLRMHSFYYQDDAPLPDSLPPYPIPGSSSSPDDLSSAAFLSHPLPSYVGQTYTALCSFWAILHEVALLYFRGDKAARVEKVAPGFATKKYQELLLWADGLHISMARGDQCPSHGIIFQ